MKIDQRYIKGRFLKECKNRFICMVNVNNEVIECYVPSASRLANYIKLIDKEVLIIENKGKNTRTKYSLVAVKHYNSYILLNLNYANLFVKEYLNNNYKFDNLFCEKVIEGYKTDFVLENKNEMVLVEAKGIISASKEIVFPSVYSERAVKQLELLLILLDKGYKAKYFFVSLSSTVKNVLINPEDTGYRRLLLECAEKGMDVIGLRCCLRKDEIHLISDLHIELS